MGWHTGCRTDTDFAPADWPEEILEEDSIHLADCDTGQSAHMDSMNSALHKGFAVLEDHFADQRTDLANPVVRLVNPEDLADHTDTDQSPAAQNLADFDRFVIRLDTHYADHPNQDWRYSKPSCRCFCSHSAGDGHFANGYSTYSPVAEPHNGKGYSSDRIENASDRNEDYHSHPSQLPSHSHQAERNDYSSSADPAGLALSYCPYYLSWFPFSNNVSPIIDHREICANQRIIDEAFHQAS